MREEGKRQERREKEGGGGYKSHDGMSTRKRGAERWEKEGKVTFWNVSGLKNNDKGFWGEVEKWDVVMMSETWMDVKDWLSMKRILPQGYTRSEKGAGKREGDGWHRLGGTKRVSGRGKKGLGGGRKGRANGVQNKNRKGNCGGGMCV